MEGYSFHYPSYQPIYYNPQTPNYHKLLNDYYQLSANFNELKSNFEKVIQKNAQLQRRIQELEEKEPIVKISETGQTTKKHKKITKKRKRNQALVNQFDCPYQLCSKAYASSLALNLHIKLKHNGGTKKQREAYARTLIQNQKYGKKSLKTDISFPPGYLEKFRKLITIKKSLEK